MEKLDPIYRPIKIEDYNRMVDVVNEIIDHLSEKPTIQVFWNEVVENLSNFTKLDITLPYDRSILINDLESLKELWLDFNLPYEISKKIIDYLGMNLLVNVNIHFEESEEVKDIAISQWEISLEALEKSKKNATPNKWRKEKDAWAKSTRTSSKKNSRTGKRGVWKRKS